MECLGNLFESNHIVMVVQKLHFVIYYEAYLTSVNNCDTKLDGKSWFRISRFML